jgi:phosphatidylserine/phosphatidylglycerophosphate/cardiolipin synthase-like enzyme
MVALDLDAVVIALSPCSEVLEGVLGLSAKGLLDAPTASKTIASFAGLSSAKLPALQKALHAGGAVGVFKEEKSGDWALSCSRAEAIALCAMLRSINLYKVNVERPLDEVTVVVSKPANPSRFVELLERSIEGFGGMQTTAHALIDLAHRAKKRFTVMTPFLDEPGMTRVVELFESTQSNVVRELIIRRPIPEVLLRNIELLKRLNVSVLDFRIARDEVGEHETFHAKVVRIDEDECYVGSSNMTQWSFNYSLELGFLVRGAAGRRVSKILDAVQGVSEAVSL